MIPVTVHLTPNQLAALARRYPDQPKSTAIRKAVERALYMERLNLSLQEQVDAIRDHIANAFYVHDVPLMQILHTLRHDSDALNSKTEWLIAFHKLFREWPRDDIRKYIDAFWKKLIQAKLVI